MMKSNSSGGGRKDIIQISLGPTANAITAHSLNLQGLAATSALSSSIDPYNNTIDDVLLPICKAETTHHVQNRHWVPRVLMIDEPTRYFVPQQEQQQQEQQFVLQQQQQQQILSSTSLSFPMESFMDPNWAIQHETPKWNSDILGNASVLAYSSHSRYYSYQDQEHTSTPQSYQVSQENSRHVVWDDDDDEPEQDDRYGRQQEEEDPQERLLRMQREKRNWYQNTYDPVQEKLTNLDWQALGSETTNFLDFWMPPYSPKSLLALPVSHQSSMVTNWDAYYYSSGHNSDGSSIINEWKEDVLFERVRQFLEESDGCQGVSILTDGTSGIYAGLATALLQELQEECPSAGRLVYSVDSGPKSETGDTSNNNNNNSSDENDGNSNWHSLHVNRLRHFVGSGLALHDLCQNAHAVIPLRLPTITKEKSFFQATAELAMAMESLTLPVRLNDDYLKSNSSTTSAKNRYRIGLQNTPFFGGHEYTYWGSTSQRLSISEFLQTMKPSNQYSVLEVDVMNVSDSATTTTTASNTSLWESFKVGTSVERDQRMREETSRQGQLRRPRDVAPGEWLEDIQYGGMMKSASYSTDSKDNHDIYKRSLHHHFALGVSARTLLQDDISQYLTCLVQGMGIRYRPERSMCTVLNQTIGQLTQGGGGAGAYWGSLIGVETPVVAVIGNTTRIYPYLDRVASEFKTVLGPRYRGYYQRDLVSGVLPEREDCEEALASCFDIRDVYHPPDGSGLVEDDGEDFL